MHACCCYLSAVLQSVWNKGEIMYSGIFHSRSLHPD
jgi:hypothetical protein